MLFGVSFRQREAALKILSLSQVFPRHPQDFTAPFLLHWCEALKKQGVDVTFLVPHSEGLQEHEKWDAVEIKRFRYGSDKQENLCYSGEMHSIAFSSLGGFFRLLVYLFSAFKALRHELKENSYDQLIIHWAIPSGIVAFLLKIFTGQKYSIISHGTDIRLFSKLGPFKIFLKPIWASATHCYTVSDFLGNLLGMSTTSIPMPLPFFYNERSISKRDDEVFRILYVGRMSEQKRLHMITEAFTNSPIPENWRLRIVGDGVTKEDFISSCKSFEEQLEVYPPVQPDQLIEHYKNSDVVILPSTNEGFGLVLVEAMAYGCYLLGAKSGAIPEIIANSDVGELFETSEELRKLLDIVYSENRVNQERSSQIFEQRFSPSVIGKNWGDALRRNV